jgi:hypothetical protein
MVVGVGWKKGAYLQVSGNLTSNSWTVGGFAGAKGIAVMQGVNLTDSFARGTLVLDSGNRGGRRTCPSRSQHRNTPDRSYQRGLNERIDPSV